MTPIMFRNAAIAQRGCIAEVQIENELEAFYSKIGCEMIQFLPLGRKFLLVVDEEGKLRDWKAGFRLGAAEGIAGNALIVREKSNGDFTDCRLPAGLIAGMTQFIDLEKTPLPPPAFGIAILTDLRPESIEKARSEALHDLEHHR